jgi:prepilin-type N-terminal cleavage/methylation domain-containing protein
MGFRGFTLVEMLVAVALVLLMMSMFAQIFQLAGGTITTQRGIAENDQRSRTVQNIIKGDLDKRTFRLVMPWSVGENGSLVDTDGINREGYFSYSENDPLNDLDDEIQFTINVNTRVKNPDLTPLYGKASAGPAQPDPNSWGWVNSNGVLTFANQPEADDGWSTPNGTAEAPAAEISYFVRGGKLYRRMLLIRKPLPLSGSDGEPLFNDRRDAFDVTPLDPAYTPATPVAYGGINHGTYTSTFWYDFDHSAFMVDNPNNTQTTSTDPYADNVPIPARAMFHSVDDLSNSAASTQFPLGDPRFRFGHNTTSGRPREFDSNGVYFGRFTHEETSHFDFKYPHNYGAAGDPHTSVLNLNTTTNVFPAFAGGLRRGEDLLLSNVHSFDVKIWDPGALGGAGAFVNIGQSITPQDPNSPNAVNFAIANRSNVDHGPINTSSPFAAPYNVNRVLDTWYPFPAGVIVPPNTPKIDLDGNNQNDPPPFRHVIYGAGATSGSYGVAVGKAPNLGVRQQPTWLASQPYNIGDLVFPSQTAANQRDNGLRFVYRCVDVVGTPSTGRTEPTTAQWPAVAGARMQDPETDLSNHYVWEAVDNWSPVRAIQITIRFHDVTSDQIRQQTIVHALAD